MWLKTVLRTGTETLRVLLRLWRLLNPSRSSRRTTRSITSDWEMPKSSNVCGIGGLNAVLAGVNVAAMEGVRPHYFIGQNWAFDYTVLCFNGGSSSFVYPRVKVRRSIRWSVLTYCFLSFACIYLAAATPAEQLFQQAQKAERAGEVVKAYLLYAEAAAADPSNA